MDHLIGRSDPARFCILFIFASLIIALLIVEPSQTVNGASETIATYSQGTLHVTIPYRNVPGGAGQLTVEVVDPEDKVLGRSQHQAEIVEKRGFWREEIKLDQPLALDDLVWHRVRYRFDYSDAKEKAVEGAESISQILRTPVVHILGQQSYLSGGQAAIRVIVTDTHDEIIGGATRIRKRSCFTPDA